MRFLLHEPRSYIHNCIADSEDGPVSLQLPEQWLWDIVDEFIYQFQSFYVWRSRVKTKTEEELVMLADGSQASGLNVFAFSYRYFTLGAGLERIQCPQRALFSHPKIQDQRVHTREAARKVRS